MINSEQTDTEIKIQNKNLSVQKISIPIFFPRAVNNRIVKLSF